MQHNTNNGKTGRRGEYATKVADEGSQASDGASLAPDSSDEGATSLRGDDNGTVEDPFRR